MAKKKTARKTTKKKPAKRLTTLEKITNVLENLANRLENLEGKKSNKRSSAVDIEDDYEYDDNPLTKKSKGNLFDKIPERNLHKEDTETDKKLWSGKSPSERNRVANMKEMNCSSCQKPFNVYNPEIYMDSPFVCNDCITGKKKG